MKNQVSKKKVFILLLSLYVVSIVLLAPHYEKEEVRSMPGLPVVYSLSYYDNYVVIGSEIVTTYRAFKDTTVTIEIFDRDGKSIKVEEVYPYSKFHSTVDEKQNRIIFQQV